MRHPRLVAVALTAVLAACASSGTASAGAVAPAGSAATSGAAGAAGAAGTAAKPDAAVLTSDEITKADLPTAYDLVERLRRPWLRRQGAQGGEVVVYMDEQKLGGAASLRDIPSVEVRELQYLTNEQATRRWGSQLTGAVIVVVRRR